MNPVTSPAHLPLQVADVVSVDGHTAFEGLVGHPSEVEHGCQQDLRAAQTVAALYVDSKGVYANLPGVEVWGEAKDARLYAGPWPVVAHPPCARWCRLAGFVEARFGHKRGDDGGTFAAALEAVRRFGGVLEHPAYSAAWRTFALPRPTRGMWVQSLLDPGWVTEVSQSAYGHPTRKRTWLYFVGGDPPALDWREPVVTLIVSDLGPGRTRKRGAEWIAGVQGDKASATPLAFRDVLLEAARRG